MTVACGGGLDRLDPQAGLGLNSRRVADITHGEVEAVNALGHAAPKIVVKT
jgi:hypothetical protein